MNTTEKKHIIWTNNLDYSDWEDDLKENYPELTDDERYNLMYEINDEYLEDEKENLNKKLGRDLVMIGTLGLWYGTRHGWKHINGSNLNDIFQGTCGDYVTWYVNEEGDVCCEDIHHDGTNHYVYRAIKENIDPWEFDELMDEGKDIDKLTDKLGDYVADVYGFEREWKE